MKTWSFYDAQTGLFVRKNVGISARDMAGAVSKATPKGCLAIEGRYDCLSQRVDVATGKVVDYVPPQPDDQHEWDQNRKRWVRRAELVRAEIAGRQALERIAAIEAENQRAVRDALLKLLPDGPEKERIAETEAEIEALRPAIRSNTSRARN